MLMPIHFCSIHQILSADGVTPYGGLVCPVFLLTQYEKDGKVASLEGGEDCVALASGVGALSGLFFSLLISGDTGFSASVWG